MDNGRDPHRQFPCVPSILDPGVSQAACEFLTKGIWQCVVKAVY